MAGVPNRLQPTTALEDNIAYVNDNFDKLATNIASFGGKTTSQATGSVTLATGIATTISIGIIDSNNSYANGITLVTPRLEVFVDNDNLDPLTWGVSTTISAAQNNAQISVHMNRRPTTGTVGVGIINIRNNDTSTHTYFYHIDFQYVAAPFTPTTASGGGFA